MEKFAFIIHPLFAKKDIARKYPFVKALPESWVEFALRYKGPMEVSHITGIKSITGAQAEGWFVGCPLTPKLMTTLPIEEVWRKIIATVRIAEDHGAKIIGLGAFTSVVGDGGITVANNSKIAVTTGNSFTVATAIEGSIAGARTMGIDPAKAHVAIVGATGSIGKTCAEILGKQSETVTLVGRNRERLDEFALRLAPRVSAKVGFNHGCRGRDQGRRHSCDGFERRGRDHRAAFHQARRGGLRCRPASRCLGASPAGAQ